MSSDSPLTPPKPSAHITNERAIVVARTERPFSPRMQGEVLYHRVGQQIPRQVCDRGHSRLVGRPVELHLEPLALPDVEYLAESQAMARAGDRLPLRIVYLRLEHYFHDHPRHVSSR